MPVYTTVLAEGAETLNPFDFRSEMRETRLRVDALLLSGKTDEAESYMEARRNFFWENGYRLRKINQDILLFRFLYDTPAVEPREKIRLGQLCALRARYASLNNFLQVIRSVISFDQLMVLWISSRRVRT